MKIHFTKKEYEALLDVMYIADWVIRAHEEDDNPAVDKYKELEQKIYALAEEFGLSEAVGKNFESGLYFLKKEHLNSSPAVALLERFENATFWEELLERLARRDFIRKHGEEAIIHMPLEERFEREMEILRQYDKEFGDNGLENLQVAGLTVVERKKAGKAPIN